MIIDKITEINRTRSRIKLDDGSSFVLYKGELRKFKLSEGADIPDAVYEEIMGDILPKRAKLRAMNLLTGRDYTSKQLRDKLLLGEYPEQIIDIAMDYVTSYGYVDDYRYAKEYIEYHKSSKNRVTLTNALLQRGISKDIIYSTLNELEEDDLCREEKNQIKAFLKKKSYDSTTFSYEDKMKIKASLYRKGYDLGLIDDLMN